MTVFSKFYWNFHADRLTPDGTDRKSQLTKVIEGHRPKVEKMLKAWSMKMTSLQNVDFNRFEEIPWVSRVSRQKPVKSHKLTPIYTKNTSPAKYTYVLGHDTLFKLKAPEKIGKVRSIKKAQGRVKKTPEMKTLKRESDSELELEEHEVKSVSSSSSFSYEPEARKRKRSLPARVSTTRQDDVKEREQRMIRMISEDIENGSSASNKLNIDVPELEKELEKYKTLWAEEKKRASKYVSLWKNERRKLEESKAAYNRLKRSSGLVV